jgi:acetolactate synthase-1/2/3 large subunit
VKILVIDNGSYGTIRMHQEKHYPGRVFGTDLRNPDFAALARAYGAEGFTAARDEEVLPALEAAFAARGAAVVHVKLATDAILPTTTLTAIRAKALCLKRHGPRFIPDVKKNARQAAGATH